MKILVLVGIVLAVSTAAADVKDIDDAADIARETLDAIYLSDEVVRYCERRPMPKKPLIIHFRDLDLEIHCDARKERLAAIERERRARA